METTHETNNGHVNGVDIGGGAKRATNGALRKSASTKVKKDLEEIMTGILSSARRLAVAYRYARANSAHISMEYRHLLHHGEEWGESAFGKRATADHEEFSQALQCHAYSILSSRNEAFDHLVELKVDGGLLALIGASWGEVAALVDVCSSLGTVESNVRVPALGLLPFLSASEHLEQMLGKTFTLGALLETLCYSA